MIAAVQTWHWLPRQSAPEPQAAVAWGEAATILLRRLLGMVPEVRARYRVTACMDAVIVVGGGEALPWVPEIRYAAPHPDAPELWLPTLWQPDVPVDLLARKLVRQFQRQPLLLWREPALLLPLDRVLPASAEVLMRIAAHRQEPVHATA